jgi:uncharacterized protein (TIGR03382 family)
MGATALALSAAGTVTAGTVTPINPFNGQMTETWEQFQNYQQNPNFYEDATGPVTIFGGKGIISTQFSGQGGIMAIYEPSQGATFGLADYGSAQVHDGTKGMGIDTSAIPTTIRFTNEVVEFGGWWGCAGFSGDPNNPSPIRFSFFDVNGALIDNATVNYSDPTATGTLMWAGWSSTTPIKSIEYFGDFVVNDGLQANKVPAPGALALLGLSGLVARRRRR